jgi:hypothetical protein
MLLLIVFCISLVFVFWFALLIQQQDESVSASFSRMQEVL